MKTRVVYPQMWYDEKFAECNISTKLLFCYLINNPLLGLSQYLHITNRQVMFDTGLNANQLATGQEELAKLGWCFFTENWVYQNHKAAYISYEGNEKVITSKQQEIDAIPTHVKEVFEGLRMGFKPNINHKPEIINHKSETRGIVKGDFRQALEEIDLASIVEKYQVPLSFVTSKLDDLDNWLTEKPSRAKGRNLRSTLMAWVKGDAIKLRKEDHAKSKIAYVGEAIS